MCDIKHALHISDFLFMEGYAAVFKIALALLSVFEEDIIASESFESATNILKIALPDMSAEQTELVFNKVRESAKYIHWIDS